MLLRTMRSDEWPKVASLIMESTNAWYQEHYGHAIFTCTVAEIEELFCGVYEALDPDCCIVAEVDGVIAASCFYHPRETHDALGIMNVHPDYAGQSLGRLLLNEIIGRSRAAGKSLRLIPSAMNLDSYSLYNRAGFQALALYQDMLIEVSEDGLNTSLPNEQYVRPATVGDLDEIVTLEMHIHGLDKRKDYEFYLANTSNAWELLVYDNDGISGALVSVKHPASHIVGHGIMREPEVAAALIYRALDRYRGMTPLVIIPAIERDLLQSMYAIKAKNCELHIAQVLDADSLTPAKGIVIPTFMPENG